MQNSIKRSPGAKAVKKTGTGGKDSAFEQRTQATIGKYKFAGPQRNGFMTIKIKQSEIFDRWCLKGAVEHEGKKYIKNNQKQVR